MSRSLNGLPILRRDDGMIFIALPEPLWAPACFQPCACATCKRGASLPAWDTIALPAEKPTGRPDTTWTVHYPEFAQRERIHAAEYGIAKPSEIRGTLPSTPDEAVDLLYRFVDYLAIDASAAACQEVMSILAARLAELPPTPIPEDFYRAARKLAGVIESAKP